MRGVKTACCEGLEIWEKNSSKSQKIGSKNLFTVSEVLEEDISENFWSFRKKSSKSHNLYKKQFLKIS